MKKDFKVEKVVSENGDIEYFLSSKDGQFDRVKLERWYEKSKDKYHVKFSREQREITGRGYIAESRFDENSVYEFDRKEGKRCSVNWKSRLTDDELERLNEAERVISELKELAMTRKPKSKDETIEELQEELERLRKLLEESNKR